MTLLQVEELAGYWVEHPPLHLLIGAYLGLGKARPKRTSSEIIRAGPQAASDVGAVLAQLGPGFCAGEVEAGLSPVVLDFAELRRRAEAKD